MLGWKKTNTEKADQNDKIDRRHEYFVITLRCLAAAYILYMGSLGLKNAIDGQAGVSMPVAIVVALVFLAAALGILAYTWRAWKKLKQTMAQEALQQQEDQPSREALMEAADSDSDEAP